MRTMKYISFLCVTILLSNIINSATAIQTITTTTLPDPCAGRSCSSHGICEHGVCNCNDGYSGDNCEQVLVPVTTPVVNPSVIYAPVPTSGPSEITCTADGNPSPTVLWYDPRDIRVLYVTASKVYQRYSRLNIKKAEKADAGVYTCKAWNSINGKTYEKYATATLKVLGKPKILRVNQSYCQTNISVTVEWKPDPDSLSIAHRINLYKQGGGWIGPIAVVPTKLQEVTTIGDLEEDSTYRIRIEVCPESCIYDLRVISAYFKTAGLPSSVSNAQTQLVDSVRKKQCVVTWTDNMVNPSYEINATSSLVYKSPLATITEFMETRNSTETSFDFQTQPNREYQFSIRARTCAGLGPPTMVSGQCITDAEAPTTIPTPVLQYNNSNGDYEITIKQVDENNGLVSCYYVILQAVNMHMSISQTNRYFTKRDFMNIAQFTQGMKDFVENVEYIAAAMKRSEVSKSLVNIALGNDAITECNALGIFMNSTSGSDAHNETYIHKGRNIPLRENHIYKAFIVVSTPVSPNVVQYKASEIVNLPIQTAETVSSRGPLIIILCVVIPIAVVVMVVCVFVVWKRYKRNMDTSPKNQQNEVNRHVEPPIQAQNLQHQPNVGNRIFEEG